MSKRDISGEDIAIAYARGFTTEQQARMIRAEVEMRRAFAKHFERERRRETRDRDLVLAVMLVLCLVVVSMIGGQ